VGKLITITGADRVGKATQSKLLTKVLDARTFSFPNYNSLSGQLVRGALTTSSLRLQRRLEENGHILEEVQVGAVYDKRENPYHFQCLQMLGRLEAQPVIEEALQHGHVVCDRYDVDALVYGELDGCKKWWLRSFLTCIKPSDLVIILNGPSFDREEYADINEKDLGFMKTIKSRYEELYHDSDIDTIIVNTVTGKDKLVSIWSTHIVLISRLMEYLGIDLIPLDLEEVKELLSV